MARILIACEESGTLRDRFINAGHHAVSIDILPGRGEHTCNHIQNDVRMVINGKWDLMIAHPPCTYLSSSGLHWNKRDLNRRLQTIAAADFFMELWNAPYIPYIAIENPVGYMSTYFRKPDQYIQPYEYGDDASKKTGLWLKGLPKLVPTNRVAGRIVNGKERWSNQTDSGQNRLAPGPDRAKDRSVTYPGIADAIVDQWGELL